VACLFDLLLMLADIDVEVSEAKLKIVLGVLYVWTCVDARARVCVRACVRVCE
jgi:hypothetical protein